VVVDDENRRHVGRKYVGFACLCFDGEAGGITGARAPIGWFAIDLGVFVMLSPGCDSHPKMRAAIVVQQFDRAAMPLDDLSDQP